MPEHVGSNTTAQPIIPTNERPNDSSRESALTVVLVVVAVTVVILSIILLVWWKLLKRLYLSHRLLRNRATHRYSSQPNDYALMESVHKTVATNIRVIQNNEISPVECSEPPPRPPRSTVNRSTDNETVVT